MHFLFIFLLIIELAIQLIELNYILMFIYFEGGKNT